MRVLKHRITLEIELPGAPADALRLQDDLAFRTYLASLLIERIADSEHTNWDAYGLAACITRIETTYVPEAEHEKVPDEYARTQVDTA